VKVALRNGFNETRYFTYASTVLGKLRVGEASLLEFMGTRVSEIKSNSNLEEE
jgi:hypothetical protein